MRLFIRCVFAALLIETSRSGAAGKQKVRTITQGARENCEAFLNTDAKCAQRPHPFMVASVQHSGSTWLTHAIRQASEIEHNGEILLTPWFTEKRWSLIHNNRTRLDCNQTRYDFPTVWDQSKLLQLFDMIWGLRPYDKSGDFACFRITKTAEQFPESASGYAITAAAAKHLANGLTWHLVDGWAYRLPSQNFIWQLKDRCVRMIMLVRLNAISHSVASGGVYDGEHNLGRKDKKAGRGWKAQDIDMMWYLQVKAYRDAHDNLLDATVPVMWLPYETLSDGASAVFPHILGFLGLSQAGFSQIYSTPKGQEALGGSTKHHKKQPWEYIHPDDLPKCEKAGKSQPFDSCYKYLRECMLNDTCTREPVTICGKEVV